MFTARYELNIYMNFKLTCNTPSMYVTSKQIFEVSLRSRYPRATRQVPSTGGWSHGQSRTAGHKSVHIRTVLRPANVIKVLRVLNLGAYAEPPDA